MHLEREQDPHGSSDGVEEVLGHPTGHWSEEREFRHLHLLVVYDATMLSNVSTSILRPKVPPDKF